MTRALGGLRGWYEQRSPFHWPHQAFSEASQRVCSCVQVYVLAAAFPLLGCAVTMGCLPEVEAVRRRVAAAAAPGRDGL